MVTSTVALRVTLFLALAFLFPSNVILLLVFSIILLGSLSREHLTLHCDIRAAFLGHQEVFDLPGHAAVPQHENDPVGTHHESTEGKKKQIMSLCIALLHSRPLKLSGPRTRQVKCFSETEPESLI